MRAAELPLRLVVKNTETTRLSPGGTHTELYWPVSHGSRLSPETVCARSCTEIGRVVGLEIRAEQTYGVEGSMPRTIFSAACQ